MLSKQLRVILSGLATFAFATSTWAVCSAPYGWYLEANGGSATVTDQSNTTGVKTSSSGWGYGGNAGYKFLPFLGLEIGYTSYPNVVWKQQPSDSKIGTQKYYSYDVAAKGILPLMDTGVEAFGKVGIGHLVAHLSVSDASAAQSVGVSGATHSATGLLWGGGLQYYFMPEFAVVGQWARVQGSNATGNESMLSGGVSLIIS
jgi:hypothetical protein